MIPGLLSTLTLQIMPHAFKKKKRSLDPHSQSQNHGFPSPGQMYKSYSWIQQNQSWDFKLNDQHLNTKCNFQRLKYVFNMAQGILKSKKWFHFYFPDDDNFLTIKCMLKIILELVFLFLYLRIKSLIPTCLDY